MTFLLPAVLKLLSKNNNLMPITMPEADLAAIFA
jgi:hypothetical protein